MRTQPIAPAICAALIRFLWLTHSLNSTVTRRRLLALTTPCAPLPTL
jgi:hypothetical protein